MSDFKRLKQISEGGSAEQTARKRPDLLELVVFVLGGNLCAVEAEKIFEVLPAQNISPLAPDHFYRGIEGFFVRGNNRVLVIDMREYVGIKNRLAGGTFLVLNTSKREIALHVDSLVGVNVLDQKSVLVPESSIRAAVGAAKIDGKSVAIFDSNIIVSDIFKNPVQNK